MSLSPRLVTLGTAGGPRWWSGERSGIATAVVVGLAAHLVDAGTGVGRQLKKAGLEIPDIRAVSSPTCARTTASIWLALPSSACSRSGLGSSHQGLKLL